MTRTVVVLVLSLAAVLVVGGEATDYHRKLLAEADSRWSYVGVDFSAEYTITQDVPGQGRSITVAALFRRDSAETYLILILDPPRERGQGYLKQVETLWFYDPTSGRFNSTSSRERFQNTNARNSDFTRSTFAEDYRILSVERAVLGRFDTWIYELESDAPGVTYPYIRLWLTDDSRILKTEDYSLSRQLLRTTAVPAYQDAEGRLIPQTIYVVDNIAGAMIDGTFVNERTIIQVSRPSFTRLPDTLFSKAFLESTRR